MNKEAISEMEDGKEKQMMEIIADKGKPYMRKQDGFAVKMDEEKQITYKDYNDQELTLSVPAGSYLVVEENSSCPKIVTEDEFMKSNKFIEESKSEKSDGGSKKDKKIGIETLGG